MSERITIAKLKSQLEVVRRLYPGIDLDLDFANGGARLVTHGGSADVSPRVSLRIMSDILYTIVMLNNVFVSRKRNPARRVARTDMLAGQYVNRPSQITHRKPTSRLKKRRRKNISQHVGGRFPNPTGGVRIVYNRLLGGWFIVRGPHQTPLSGKFPTQEAARQALIDAKNRRDSRGKNPSRLHLRGRRSVEWQKRSDAEKDTMNKVRTRRSNRALKGSAVWSIWSLDVWGNAQDGYEVNDRSRVARAKISERTIANDRSLWEALKSSGVISAKARFEDAEFDGDDSMISIDYKGKPELQLTRD